MSSRCPVSGREQWTCAPIGPAGTDQRHLDTAFANAALRRKALPALRRPVITGSGVCELVGDLVWSSVIAHEDNQRLVQRIRIVCLDCRRIFKFTDVPKSPRLVIGKGPMVEAFERRLGCLGHVSCSFHAINAPAYSHARGPHRLQAFIMILCHRSSSEPAES